MNIRTRILCLLLSVIFVLPLFLYSCGSDDGPDTEIQSVNETESENEDTEKQSEKEALTDKDTEKETVKETEKETVKETEKETRKETDKVTEKESQTEKEVQTEKTSESEKSTEKQSEKESERETESLTEKKTETEKETECETEPIPHDVKLDIGSFKIITEKSQNSAAIKLRDEILGAFGKKLKITVCTRTPYEKGSCEILVGKTDRKASLDVYATLDKDEYCVKYIDEKTIVVAGYDDIALKKAADEFSVKYIPYDAEKRGYTVKDLKVRSDLEMRGYAIEFAEVKDASKLGFQVKKDGTVTLGGKPYQGIGMNWHGGFLLSLSNIKAGTGYDLARYFKTLADNDIPYIRTMMGVFYGQDITAWKNDKQGFFKSMDNFVALAEEYHVGIICSLMWDLSAFVSYAGGQIYDLGIENSKTMKLCREYVTDVVTRYKDSPAIWGWEIGNEGNLAADISELTTYTLNRYYEIIGDTIYKADPTRMIVGGDSYPRAPSKALRTTGQWSPNDTREDVKETLSLYTPAPLNTVSVHIYGTGPQSDFYAMIKDLKKKTDELKIGCFVGEFGLGEFAYGNLYDEKGLEDPEEVKEQTQWKGMLDEFIKADVQVLCAWCYGRMAEQLDGTSIEYGMYNNIYQNAYQMDYIREYNRSLKKEGKNCADEYWESVLTGEKYQMKAYGAK